MQNNISNKKDINKNGIEYEGGLTKFETINPLIKENIIINNNNSF